MLLRFLWVIVWLSTLTYGASLHLEGEKDYPLQGYVSYYEDSKGVLGWQDANAHDFHLYPKESINFGFTPSVYWFKLDIDRDIYLSPYRWWLTLAYPLLDHVDLYVLSPDGNLIEHKNFGIGVKHSNYPLRNFVTELPLTSYLHVKLLIRIQTQSSMQLPLSITTTSTLFSSIETVSLWIGLYYGIFLIIFLYNAVIFLYTKESNYLRYLLFLTSFVTWQLSFDGIGREYLWPDWSWFIHHASAVLIALTAFSALYFGRNFLSTALYLPKIDKAICVLMGISFFLVILSLFLPYSSVIKYNTALVSIVPIVLLIAGINVMRQGYRSARFYVVGWSSFLLGTSLLAFNKFDFIPSFYGINHVQQIGSAIEMIFLSWALADRIHLLQHEYIDKLNHLNDSLSEKVRDALERARSKDRLIAQQSRHAAMGEMIEQIAHQWRQPLNTLALINQNLYFKRQLGNCDEACYDTSHAQVEEHLLYMSKTIDDFRNYYKMDKAEMPEDIGEVATIALRLSEVFLNYTRIQTHLIVKTSRKVMIAKNEMIQVFMNLIKNAHDVIKERHIEAGEITITIQETRGWVKILIEDNGGGIDESLTDKIFDIYFTTKSEDEGTGLGLYMCRYIIEESFSGKIRVENTSRGARFTISLPIERTVMDIMIQGKN
ncbi:MAG: sensor histidine kinase [Sulfuricurvum sp.]|jgi:signal transduction histidine kinase